MPTYDPAMCAIERYDAEIFSLRKRIAELEARAERAEVNKCETKTTPHDFNGYQHELTKVERQREKLEAASAQLSNAQMRCRLAELKSQHEPLNSLRDAAVPERERLYAAAFYVVHGRMPRMGEGE